MKVLRTAGIGVWILFVATGSTGLDARAQAQHQILLTHPIDWYLGHPAALQNALLQCNVETGLVGTQDCRNAFVAAHIIATRPPEPGVATNLP
jgi:hypothetical protein